jgi:hypothetical protein
MTELEVFKQSLDVSRLTLMVSLVVSIASIAFASLEMAFQRSHNIKSVRPYCEFTAKEVGDRVSIVLRNVGLGPLIVTAVSIADSADSGEVSHDITVFEPGPDGLVLPPLEKASILSFPEAECEALSNRYLQVEYCDIYDHRHEKAQALSSIRGKGLS